MKWFDQLKRRTGCSNCRVDGIHGALLDRFESLVEVKPLKFGTLYRCSRCNRLWFLNSNRSWIHRIEEDLWPTVQKWNQASLSLNNQALEALALIGGVEALYFEHIVIPCQVRLNSGQEWSLTKVLVSKQPPYRWFKPDMVHWPREVSEISPSPFSLPLDVRIATANKEEIAMGFAPVGVIGPEGQEFTLGSRSQFFDFKGLRGTDMRLSQRAEKWKKVAPHPIPEAYIWADWFEGCEALLLR